MKTYNVVDVDVDVEVYLESHVVVKPLVDVHVAAKVDVQADANEDVDIVAPCDFFQYQSDFTADFHRTKNFTYPRRTPPQAVGKVNLTGLCFINIKFILVMIVSLRLRRTIFR